MLEWRTPLSGQTVPDQDVRPDPDSSITELLAQISQGNRDAESRLFPKVYAELHQAAARYMRRERANHTLQATALVNEAWLRLTEQTHFTWQSRTHFFALASRVMRQILVDHAREKRAEKRGGLQVQVSMEEPLLAARESPVDVLVLDQALERLRLLDERGAQMLEMHFFAGMSYDEIAGVLGISTRTVKRDWEMARTWLRAELAPVA